MISFEQIHKQYGDKVVLDHLNGTLPTQKITSLIGPNGAGKSTLLGIISRLLKQDGGNVFFMEKPLTAYKSNELAQHLSILRQANHIESRLTVRELVAFGRFPYSKGKMKPEDWAKVEEALLFTGLETMKEAYLDELSGGQRQRAFIAMIIAQDTDCILLDEPLNNLDMKHSVDMMQLLRRLVTEKGKTVVIVIHEINFAAQYSDQIIVMKDGKILYNDHAANIINPGILEEVFEIPFDIIERNGKKICNYFNL